MSRPLRIQNATGQAWGQGGLNKRLIIPLILLR